VPVVLTIGDKQVRVPEMPLGRLTDQVRQLRERVRQFAEKEASAQAVGTTGRTGAQPAAKSTTPQPVKPTAGPLAGITGIIDPLAVTPRTNTMISTFDAVVSDLQARRQKQLQALIAVQDEILRRRTMSEAEREAAEAARPAARARLARARLKLDRFAVLLILVVAVALPFLPIPTVQQSLSSVFAPPDFEKLPETRRAQLQSVFEAMDRARDGQSVLVAFEYGPTTAAEMDDLARAALRDLFKQRARPVILSTNPSGAMHAQGFVSRFVNNPDELRLTGRNVLVAGRDYAVLRYVPGGPAAVRAVINGLAGPGLARQNVFDLDAEGRPAGLDDQAFAYMRDNPALVLAESQDDVRNWAELYRAGSESTARAALQPYRVLLFSASGAGPTATAYAQSNPRILGPVVGLRDAVIYQARRGGFESAAAQQVAVQRWQSVSLALLAGAVVVALGAVFNLLRAMFARRTANKP
jgi:hypothetical protein